MFKYVAIACLLFLSACGFQLRGSYSESLESQAIFIQADNNSLKTALIAALEDSKAVLVNNLAEANATLSLKNQDFIQTPSAFDASAKVIEYALSYQLVFIVNNNTYQFAATENYPFDSTQPLSAENNRNIAEDNLREQAIRYILNTLAR